MASPQTTFETRELSGRLHQMKLLRQACDSLGNVPFVCRTLLAYAAAQGNNPNWQVAAVEKYMQLNPAPR